jgi:hypothetical protein
MAATDVKLSTEARERMLLNKSRAALNWLMLASSFATIAWVSLRTTGG